MKSFEEALKGKKKPVQSKRMKKYWDRRSARLCVECGEPLKPEETVRCKVHREKVAAAVRKQGGFKKWVPGGPGKAPQDADEQIQKLVDAGTWEWLEDEKE